MLVSFRRALALGVARTLIIMPALLVPPALQGTARAANSSADTVSDSVASGADAAGTNAADVIAQAGSITMNSADIRALVAALPVQERAAVTSNLNALEQVVQADLVQRAVLVEAKSSGFDHQPGTLTQLDAVRDEALVRLWIASKAAVPTDYPSEAQVEAAYTANRQALAAPSEYHLDQIFISAPDGGEPAKLAASLQKAVAVAARIPATDFGELARQQSEDPASAGHGGDLGYVPENRMSPNILAAIRDLKPGQVAGPIKAAQGLSFLKLLDKKPGAVPTLAQAHGTLVAALRRQRASQLEQTYLNTYSAKLGVAINQIELAKLQLSLPR